MAISIKLNKLNFKKRKNLEQDHMGLAQRNPISFSASPTFSLLFPISLSLSFSLYNNTHSIHFTFVRLYGIAMPGIPYSSLIISSSIFIFIFSNLLFIFERVGLVDLIFSPELSYPVDFLFFPSFSANKEL